MKASAILQGPTTNRFSKTLEIPRSKIEVRPELFQNRELEYSEDTVDKIVREGYDKSQEPIVVWHDKAEDVYVVISGHSRWAASEVLYKQGDQSLTKMPAKIFQGDLDDAMDYALLESNRSGTAETLKEDVAAYKRAVERGFNREYLKGIFKPESRLRLLQDLSALNPKGRFMEHLGEDSEKSFPYLQRNAQWVGILRRQYPKLTNSHEGEMFEFLYSSKKGLTIRKADFLDRVEKRVSAIDFNPKKPLNLKNAPSAKPLVSAQEEELRDMERELEAIIKDRDRAEENLVRATKAGNDRLTKTFQQKISEFNQIALRKRLEIDKFKDNIDSYAKTVTQDLFSQAAEEESQEETLDQKRARILTKLLEAKIKNGGRILKRG